MRDAAGLLLASAIVAAAPSFALCCCRHPRCRHPQVPSTPCRRRGGWSVLLVVTARRAGQGRWPRATPPASSWPRRSLLWRRSSPWRCGCRHHFVRRWCYWRWCFHVANAGAGAGVDAIFGVFIDNAVRGTDQAADASGAAANATAAFGEILSLPPRPPTLHAISASTLSLS